MKKNIIIFSILFIYLSTCLLSLTTVKGSSEPDIFAQAAIVYDVDSGTVLYDKNMHQAMYPASITKLMTALLTIDTLPPDEPITFSEAALGNNDGSSIGIRLGETLTIDQTLHGMLLMSSNPCANALAEATAGTIDDFVDLMNDKAEELGAQDTHFTNPHGLFDPNHYTSAYDMALITNQVIQSDYFMDIMGDVMYEIPPTNMCDEIRYLAQQHRMLNNKKDMAKYRADVIAGKVGYTSESGHTLVTVATNGERTLIVVVLKSDYQNVYSDTATLIDYGYDIPILETADDDAALITGAPEDDSLMDTPLDTNQEGTQPLGETETKSGIIMTLLLILKWIITVLFLGVLGLSAFVLLRKERIRKRRLQEKRNRFRNLR